MSPAHRRDAARMTGNGKPIVNRRADLAALNRRLARPVMSRNQQDQPFARFARPFQRRVYRTPRAVEIHSMQIDHAVGLKPSGPQLPVPGAVERRSGVNRPRRGRLSFRNPNRWRFHGRRRNTLLWSRALGVLRPARQRPDACCHPSPKLSLVRAEVSRHSRGLCGAQRCPSARGPAPRQRRTCRQQPALPPRPRPNRCRSGSGP
jgi:hypothetical protein